MIPLLVETPSAEDSFRGFLEALRASGFTGTVSAGDADRAVFATDNSIYQLFPQAVVFPRGTDDIARVMRLLAEPRFGEVVPAALRDAQALMAFGPASIETVDSKVLGLSQEDIVWDGVREFFPDGGSGPVRGANLIEFVGDTDEEVEAPLGRMTEALAAGGPEAGRAGHAGAPALAQGPRRAAQGVAAPPRRRRRGPGRGDPAPARRRGVADAAGARPQYAGPAPRRTRLLARVQGGDGRLPRLQVLRRRLPDQGGRPGRPREVPQALPRPLPAPGAGLPGCVARAPPAGRGAGAAAVQRGGR